MGLLVSGYAVVVVLASVPLTRLTRRIPRRQLLGTTMILFAVANVAAALASTYTVLAGARLVTALTQALFWSVASATVTGPFPAAVRGRVVALFSTGAALAPVLGVPLGTWLGQQAGWRTSFAVLAGVGLAIAVAVVALIPSYPPDAGGAAGAPPHTHDASPCSWSPPPSASPASRPCRPTSRRSCSTSAASPPPRWHHCCSSPAWPASPARSPSPVPWTPTRSPRC